MRWSRIEAGHYCTRRWNDDTRSYDQIHVREYVKGDWELTINGQHRGYFGRARDAKARAEGLS